MDIDAGREKKERERGCDKACEKGVRNNTAKSVRECFEECRRLHFFF